MGKEQRKVNTYNISAHNSTVIVGNSGEVTCSNISAYEMELLRLFQSLSMRDQVKIINNMYELIDKKQK